MKTKLKQSVSAIQVGDSGNYRIEKAVNLLIPLCKNVDKKYLELLMENGIQVTIGKVR